MTDAVSTEKTHYIHASYKSGNGRRVTKDFPCTEFQATDPAARASAISGASAYGFGAGWNLVNWSIKEGTPPAPKAKK